MNQEARLRRPEAVLFDLFHTLVSVPKPGGIHGPSVAEALGIPEHEAELQRRYHDDDVLGRCLGHVRDPREVMRRLARGLSPSVTDARIEAALASRRRRFEQGLVGVDPRFLVALDALRAAGIRTALVSDAGCDDVESWHLSPLATRFDATVFSYELGVRKPDPRIYFEALGRIGVAPAAAIFVGDGGSDEHRGARSVGMGTVLVTSLLAHEAPEVVAGRRPHADRELADVAAFVASLLG